VDVLSSSSPLWDRAVRVEVQQTMMSTAELNRHRSKCLLPGRSRLYIVYVRLEMLREHNQAKIVFRSV